MQSTIGSLKIDFKNFSDFLVDNKERAHMKSTTDSFRIDFLTFLSTLQYNLHHLSHPP